MLRSTFLIVKFTLERRGAEMPVAVPILISEAR
jgi:hypothetical protein